MNKADRMAKEELARYHTNKKCCKLAELSALFHVNGVFTRRAFVMESANVYTAKKAYSLVHELFSLETSVIKVKADSPRRQNLYRVEIREQPGFHQSLNELGILDSTLSPIEEIPRRITSRLCCVSAALRGGFLGGGYLGDFYKQADLEITSSSEKTAESFLKMLERISFNAKMRHRRGNWVIYMKSREQISRLLATIGAHHSHLEWENRRILNGTRNEVNRLVNCDAANAKRTAVTSAGQIEEILELKKRGLLEHADPKLVELAEKRLENPHCSFAEIGRLLSPPVTKSVVQNRFRHLSALLQCANGIPSCPGK
ncbi:MAG: DNA-binding protein WhiA [Actinomycetota bacterium]|nr:DNA-binding protein WhiA [Actinomycetota bacterium]